MPKFDENIAAKAQYRLGIDLGGTKTEVVVLDHKFQPIYRKRVPTPAHEYGAILALITDLVRQAGKSLPVKPTVGIGTPGAISRITGLLRNSSTPCLNGKPFVSDIERRLRSAVKIQNAPTVLPYLRH